MRRNGVAVDELRAIDHDIATGVWPDMTEHGWDARRLAGDLRAGDGRRHPGAGTPIWLGEKSLGCTKVIERLYGNSHLLNDAGQYAYYGRVGGCLVTGNEDGVKHCAMNVLYSCSTSATRSRRRPTPAGSARPARAVLSRPGLGRAGERLHQPQHHVHDLEPAAPGADAEGRRRDPGPRQPAPSGTRAAGSTSPTPSTG